MDTVAARALLETIQAAHARVIVNDRTVEVWRAALDGVHEDEVGEALLTLLRENAHQPTPADLLRVVREQRRKDRPDEPHDPRATITIQEGARQILEDLATRMRDSGRRPRGVRT